MGRPMYRIRQITRARPRGEALLFVSAFQVQRRGAALFWCEIACCLDRVGAEAAIRADVIARRRARIKPRVLSQFDRDGQALGK